MSRVRVVHMLTVLLGGACLPIGSAAVGGSIWDTDRPSVSPSRPLDAKLLTPETAEFLQDNMEPVYENLASVVYLTERGPGGESGIIPPVSGEDGGSPLPSN